MMLLQYCCVYGFVIIKLKHETFLSHGRLSLVCCFPIKGRCLLIKDIFSPVYDYAGNVDLNKSY